MRGKFLIGWILTTMLQGRLVPFGDETNADEPAAAAAPIQSLKEKCLEKSSSLPNGLHIAIIVDGLEYNAAYMDEIAEGLSKMSKEIKSIYSEAKSDSNGDEILFSLTMAQDKSIACKAFNQKCACNDLILDKISDDELECNTDNDNKDHCNAFYRSFHNFEHLQSDDRPDIFDPIVDYADDHHKSRRLIVVVVTPQCSRHSAQFTPDDIRLQWKFEPNRYWKYVPKHIQTAWKTKSRGYDESGVVLDQDCDARDYPKVSDVGYNLKTAEGSMIVLSRLDPNRRGYHTCASSDWVELIRNDFWIEYVGDEMEKYEVPYAYTDYLDGQQLGDKILGLMKTELKLC